ncbi:hypothetical protein GX645_06490 [Candidatus Sumerlaeota bacterium]|nr:hypothetical protein [Candidatus Sumerlaeota bacterium]
MNLLLRWSERCCLFLIFASVFLTAFAYPILLPEGMRTFLNGLSIAPALGFSFWRYYFEVSYSNTVIKELMLAYTLLPLGLLLLIRQWALGQSARRKTMKEILCSRDFWLLLFWLYCALRCLPSGGGLPSWLGNPTPNIGIMTLICITCALLVLVVLRGIRNWSLVTRRFMDFVCLCGCVLALVSVVQHFGWSDSIVLKPNDPRNRIGSFIGHNVGLSAWLVFPLSFALLSVLRRDSSWLRKILSLMLVLLICWVLVAGQSRSMWILLGLLLPLYLWFQSECLGIRRAYRVRAVLVLVLGVLLIIVSQTVSPRYNPLAEKHQVSLKERLNAFRLDTLKTETRLRILVCSMSLLEERPLLGHGLGSFQYVYQPAQGSWLTRHRDSAIAGTWKRTDVAHNDPLQLLIELGGVGALLLLIPFILSLRSARRHYRTSSPDERAMRLALLFPVVVMVFHSFLDFPFHVVSLAILWVMTFGLLCGSDSPTAETDEGGVGVVRKGGLVYTVVILVCFVLYGVMIAKAFRLESRAAASDRYQILGSRQLEYAMSQDKGEPWRKGQMLQNAKALLRQAMHLNVFNGTAYESAARVDMEMGGLLEELLSESSLGTTETAAMRDMAVHNYQYAQSKLNQMMSYGELNYHYSHYLLGMANWGLWRLLKDDKYLDAARDSFTDAVMMNPADMHSQYELSQVYDLEPEKNQARLAQVKRDLFRRDASSASDLFLLPELEKTLNGQGVAAISAINRLGALVPDEWHIRLFEGELHLLIAQWPPSDIDAQTTTGLRSTKWAVEHLRLAESMIRQVVQNHPEADEPIDLAVLHLLVASGKLAEAVEHASVNMRVYPNNLEFATLYYELSRELGKNVEEPYIVTRNRNDADNLMLYYKAFYLDQLAEVSSIIYVRAQDKQALIDTRPFVRVGEYVINHGRLDMAQTLLEWMKAHPSFDPRRRECLKDVISEASAANK